MKKIYTKDGNFALVDDEDFDLLNNYKWHQDYKGYFVTCTKQKSFRMHRIIMDCPKELVVDHINSITTDNRKINLRICTRQQNGYNCKPNREVKYKGVSWNWKIGKWQARVTYKDLDYICGYFDTEEEAALSYNKKSRELPGEYAYKNVIN